MPVLANEHIDRALTNLSILYKNDTLVGDLVAPPLPVDKRSNKYFVYNKDSFLRASGTDANGNPLSVRRPGTAAATVDWDLSTQSYYCEELALNTLVTDASVKYADDPLQPDIDGTYLVTERVKLDNEVQVAKLALTSANYPTAGKVSLTSNSSTGTSWYDYNSSASNPFTDTNTAKAYVRTQIMRDANTMLLSYQQALTLMDHPIYKDQVKYTAPEGINFAGVVKNFRGLETIVASQQIASNVEGAAFTRSNVWVDDNGYAIAMVYYRDAGTGPRTVHSFRTFDAPDDTTGVRGYQIRRWRDDKLKGQYIECSVTRDWKAVAIDASNQPVGAYLISDAGTPV